MTYQELMIEQKQNYPYSTIISQHELLEFHIGTKEFTMIESFFDDYPNAVGYFLPAGQYGASDKLSCNGIRYGEHGAYLALPHINITESEYAS